jgi:glycosyltransferase involved in cell wall biosynthesis
MLSVFVVSPALTMGGMERASLNLAEGLASRGYIVFYVTILKKEHFFKPSQSIQVIEPEGFNSESVNLLKTVLWLRNLAKTHKPDVIVVYNKVYGSFMSFALMGLPFKFIVSERSSPLYKWPLKFEWLCKLAFTMHPPNGVISQTRIAAKIQSDYYSYKTKIKIIPNSLREVMHFPKNKRENFIIGVGRLAEWLKGFDLLIESYAKCKNKHWKLVLVGSNVGAEHLVALANKLGVKDQVQFYGSTLELDEILSRAGIFVIPSRSEGFPNALIEAMAAGVPCISFNFIAGPQDIIEDGVNGLLVELGNTDKMAETIDKLIEDENMREKIAFQGMQAVQRYKPEAILDEYENFLFNLK